MNQVVSFRWWWGLLVLIKETLGPVEVLSVASISLFIVYLGKLIIHITVSPLQLKSLLKYFHANFLYLAVLISI